MCLCCCGWVASARCRLQQLAWWVLALSHPRVEGSYKLGSFFSSSLLACFIPFYPHFPPVLTPRAPILMCFNISWVSALASVFSEFVFLTYVNDDVIYVSTML